MRAWCFESEHAVVVDDDDRPVMLCDKTGRETPLMTYEVIVLLDGKRIDCVYADETVGVVIEMLERPPDHMLHPKWTYRTRKGDVTIRVHSSLGVM